MPKFFTRIVAALLVPTLVVNPVFAQGNFFLSIQKGPILWGQSSAIFLAEALAPEVLQTTPISDPKPRIGEIRQESSLARSSANPISPPLVPVKIAKEDRTYALPHLVKNQPDERAPATDVEETRGHSTPSPTPKSQKRQPTVRDYSQSRYIWDRERDIGRATMEQFKRSPVYQRYVAADKPDLAENWTWFAGYLPSVLFEDRQHEEESKERQYEGYRNKLIDSNGYVTEGISDAAVRSELLETFYLECIRQVFLSILRHPAQQSPEFVDHLMSSLPLLLESIRAFGRPDYETRLAQTFSYLLPEAMVSPKSVDIQYGSFRSRPDHKIEAGPFAILSYLLVHPHGNSPALIQRAFGELVSREGQGTDEVVRTAGEDDAAVAKWMQHHFQEAEEALIIAGRTVEVVQAYLTMLPKLYEHVASVPTKESVAKRNLIDHAETVIRQYLPADQAKDQLARIHRMVLPGLLQDHNHPMITDRFGFVGVNLMMMART